MNEVVVVWNIVVWAGYPIWSDILPFSIFARIPDIETIRTPDILLIFNDGYIRYPAKKYPAQP